MKKFINKLASNLVYTKKWQLYTDYIAIICGSILVYQRWTNNSMSGFIIWSLFTLIALFRLKQNNWKFVSKDDIDNELKEDK